MRDYCETGFAVPPEAGIIIDEFREQAGVSKDVFFIECATVGMMCAEQYLDNRAEGFDTTIIWHVPGVEHPQWEFLTYEEIIPATSEVSDSFDVVDPFIEETTRYYMIPSMMPEIQPMLDALDISLLAFMKQAIELRIGLLRVQQDGGTLVISKGAEEYWYFAPREQEQR